MGRVDEAVKLLDAELPSRLDYDCPACGATGRYWKLVDEWIDRGPPGSKQPCRERGEVTCRFCAGSGKRTTYHLGWSADSPNRKTIERCTECYGTGKREQDVDMLVPHESRILLGGKR